MMTDEQKTIPHDLRPHVEAILHYHYATSGGRSFSVSGDGVSITAASCDRAAMLSQRVKTCPACAGLKVRDRVLHRSNGGVETRTEDCRTCDGSGEVGSLLVADTATGECGRCHGSGQYRVARQRVTPRGRGSVVLSNAAFLDVCAGCRIFNEDGTYTWHVNPGHDPSHELGRCVQCRGKGSLPGLDAQHGPEAEPGGWSPADDPDTPVGVVLTHMRHTEPDGRGVEFATSVAALEIAFGEVGDYVTRLGEPRDLALWPMTKHGKALIEQLTKERALTPGAKPHKALARARGYSDPFTQVLIGRAQAGAVAAIELGMQRLWTADAVLGGKVEQMAKRMERRAA